MTRDKSPQKWITGSVLKIIFNPIIIREILPSKHSHIRANIENSSIRSTYNLTKNLHLNFSVANEMYFFGNGFTPKFYMRDTSWINLACCYLIHGSMLWICTLFHGKSFCEIETHWQRLAAQPNRRKTNHGREANLYMFNSKTK